MIPVIMHPRKHGLNSARDHIKEDLDMEGHKITNCSLVQADDFQAGDVLLKNGWVITEYDEDGNMIDGVIIKNNKGEEVFRIDSSGIYFRGVLLAKGGGE
ncbi:MAG TPA: hypothetical protein ENG74_02655 [Thermoplasmatales archaeon]|nr:hypothetical protein [Thermoplasmatales archaeon]